MTEETVARAEAVLGYAFSDRALLATALTHPSYLHEHPGVVSYDRLEFLGDAVLALVVAEHVYRTYPDEAEGELSRRKIGLIAGSVLTETARSLGLGDLLMVGKGVRSPDGGLAPSLLENAFEAVVGAVYLDGGFGAARALCNRVLGDRLNLEVPPASDAKGRLQELTQHLYRALPEYHITSVSGEPHQRWFTAEVRVEGQVVGHGTGRSKQAAEKAAAEAALATMTGPTGSDADAS